MRYTVKIKTNKGAEITWVNGGLGYSKEELDQVERKIKNDKRVAEYTVTEMK